MTTDTSCAAYVCYYPASSAPVEGFSVWFSAMGTLCYA